MTKINYDKTKVALIIIIIGILLLILTILSYSYSRNNFNNNNICKEKGFDFWDGLLTYTTAREGYIICCKNIYINNIKYYPCDCEAVKKNG